MDPQDLSTATSKFNSYMGTASPIPGDGFLVTEEFRKQVIEDDIAVYHLAKESLISLAENVRRVGLAPGDKLPTELEQLLVVDPKLPHEFVLIAGRIEYTGIDYGIRVRWASKLESRNPIFVAYQLVGRGIQALIPMRLRGGPTAPDARGRIREHLIYCLLHNLIRVHRTPEQYPSQARGAAGIHALWDAWTGADGLLDELVRIFRNMAPFLLRGDSLPEGLTISIALDGLRSPDGGPFFELIDVNEVYSKVASHPSVMRWITNDLNWYADWKDTHCLERSLLVGASPEFFELYGEREKNRRQRDWSNPDKFEFECKSVLEDTIGHMLSRFGLAKAGKCPGPWPGSPCVMRETVWPVPYRPPVQATARRPHRKTGTRAERIARGRPSLLASRCPVCALVRLEIQANSWNDKRRAERAKTHDPTWRSKPRRPRK